MSLLDIYAKTKAEIDTKEQAKKDLKEHKDEYFELPDGKFGSTLIDVLHGAKAGRPWTAFKFSIDYPQEYAGKKYSIFITLNETTSNGNPMPDAVLEKSMRYCLEIGSLLGIQVPASDFAGDADANGLALAKTFESAYGKGKLEVVKKSKPNPRNINFPYIDYYFNPYNRGLVQATKQLEDINEINNINKMKIKVQNQQPINPNSAQSYFNHVQQPAQQQAQPSTSGQAWNQGYANQTAEVPFPEEQQASQQPAQQTQQVQKTQAMTPAQAQAQIESVLPHDTNNQNEITITKDDIPF
ncbi:hypothetical protein [Lactobacillus crispatus]|uniref:hypothetical protein n=1 Tax=Lactobacillus crispatus TaxID=47770 RepID=UPI0030F7476C